MGVVAAGLGGGLLVCWLLVLCAYDIRLRRLPNVLTLSGAAVIAGTAVLTGHGWAAVFGAGALAMVYLMVHLLDPAAMGAGDVKLALGLGGLTGAFGVHVWVLAAVAAPLLTAVAAVAMLLCRSPSATVPHGPSMCAASAGAVALAVL